MNKDKRKRGEKSAVIADRHTSEQVRQIARKVLGQIIGKMTARTNVCAPYFSRR
jgi:hypothetical protein